MTSTYDGHCIPIAYIGGKDLDGAATPNPDECWTEFGTDISNTVLIADGGDNWLSGEVTGCIGNPDKSKGFAVCDTNFVARGENSDPALNGTC